jgi:peptide deformylase
VLLKIQQAGSPTLRHPARPLASDEIVGPGIQHLIEHMRETMRDAPGVGLAAPQVGIGLQLAVIEDRLEAMQELSSEQLRERRREPVPFFVLINPQIVSCSQAMAEFFEGCLSLAGYGAVVPRPLTVRVDYLNEKAEPQSLETTGWLARILQHEIDHLNGVLYIDRMYARSFSSLENINRNWKDAPVSEVLRQLGQVPVSVKPPIRQLT